MMIGGPGSVGAALLLIAAVGLGRAGATQAGAAAALPRQDSLEACYSAQAKLVPFSGSIFISGKELHFERLAGTGDADDRVPITRETEFRLASVQKVLTRVAIGRLVDRGLVDLDSPISKYVPGLPTEFGAIRVDDLLHHRSGVAPFTRISSEDMEKLVAARSARDLLPMILAVPLKFEPGEGDEYSNGGYWLLGVVIESVTSRDYGEHLQKDIFEPLGMGSTRLTPGPKTAVRKTRMAPGQPALEAPRPVVMREEPRGNPAGDGVSTAADMMKLGRALLGDALLKDETKARLFPRMPGLRWLIGQSGGNIGTNTDFAVFPEHGLVSVILSNFDPPAGDLMGRTLRRAALGIGCYPLRAEDAPGPRVQPGPPPPVRTP